jgi:hypothetical protein
MPQLIQPHQRFLHAALLSLVVTPNALFAATVGGVQTVDFSPTVVNNYCDVSTTGGSLVVEKKRGLITSDSGLTGTFNGTGVPGTLAVASNLISTGSVIVDPPVLKGGTAADTSELRLGSSSTWANTAQTLTPGSDGNIASTNLHVRFTTTSNGSKFANGTYNAVATVTCTDNGTK